MMKSLGLLLGVVCLVATPAFAATLQVPDDAPLWKHLGADALLYLHIGGGTIGLLAGVAAIASRKGRKMHRLVGTVFFVSMFITYLIGAGVAPFLTTGQRPNFVAGVLALYLLVSGWRTVRNRGPVQVSASHFVGLGIAMVVASLGYIFMRIGMDDPSGTIDGSPPQAFILFMAAGSIAALGELNIILRRTLSRGARIARHLWRMCFSMFIASGSLFLGQPQIFSEAFNASAWPFVLSFAPIIAIFVWLFIERVRPLIRKPR